MRLLLMILLGLATCASVLAQPVLEVVGGTKLDFGNMYRGVVMERKILLRNTGNDTLIIGHVEASCGCTGTVMSSDHIAPGSEGTLLISFNSKNFSGKIHKTVTLTTNDPKAAQATIEFEGTVIDEIVVTPEQLWFQDALVGHAMDLTVTVKNGGLEPLELKGIRTDLEGLTVQLPHNPIKPGASVHLIITFTPRKSFPVLVDGLFIKTNSVRQPEVFLPVYGSVKSSSVKP